MKNPPEWTFYYDGDCGLCIRAVRLLRRMDFRGLFLWIPSQDLIEPPLGLSWDDLFRSAYLQSDTGRLYGGFHSLRILILKLWPLLPLAGIFWFPGAGIIGNLVYRWVARNRYRISGCPAPPRANPVRKP